MEQRTLRIQFQEQAGHIQKWILDPTLEGTLESSTWVGSRILSLRRKELMVLES
jgi:hypothetical protein